MRVVVAEFMDEAALEAFGPSISVSYDATLVDDRPRLMHEVETADAIIVRNRTQVDQALLDGLTRLGAERGLSFGRED